MCQCELRSAVRRSYATSGRRLYDSGGYSSGGIEALVRVGACAVALERRPATTALRDLRSLS